MYDNERRQYVIKPTRDGDERRRRQRHSSSDACYAIVEGLPDGGNKLDWYRGGKHREIYFFYWCTRQV
jgi:hypothetical protein